MEPGGNNLKLLPTIKNFFEFLYFRLKFWTNLYILNEKSLF